MEVDYKDLKRARKRLNTREATVILASGCKNNKYPELTDLIHPNIPDLFFVQNSATIADFIFFF